jgi:hypothetical protein
MGPRAVCPPDLCRWARQQPDLASAGIAQQPPNRHDERGRLSERASFSNHHGLHAAQRADDRLLQDCGDSLRHVPFQQVGCRRQRRTGLLDPLSELSGLHIQGNDSSK